MRTDLAGQTLKIRDGFDDPYNGRIEAGTKYRVEGYWDEVTGKSWMVSDGNPACLNYATRRGTLPLDDNVLYGKIGSFGFLVHVSELTR